MAAPTKTEEHGAAHGDAVGANHPPSTTGLSNEKVAMWAFLGSECLLFGALISVYLLYKGQDPEGAITPHDVYDIPFTSVSTFVLLMSSLTMVLALAAIQRGEHRRCRVWLLTTAALGATFVGGQAYEFTVFIQEGVTLSSSLFGSSFYALTGFHGVHVTLGVLMLLSLYSLSMKGKLPKERAESVELVGLYWHFVDIVWIVLFTLVYLIK
jgi:heme/copper-type cytochrome/quinol oxidase subunit 3